VRKIFEFENPTSVQIPAIIDPTEIYQCFYLRNDHTDSCYCRNWKVTPYPGLFFHKFFTPDPKKNVESCRSRLRHPVSMATSGNDWWMSRDFWMTSSGPTENFQVAIYLFF